MDEWMDGYVLVEFSMLSVTYSTHDTVPANTRSFFCNAQPIQPQSAEGNITNLTCTNLLVIKTVPVQHLISLIVSCGAHTYT